MALSDKQKRFCDEYLIDLNATQAAIRAGYKEKYAHTNANKLLQNTTIQKYISERKIDRVERTEITQDMVLRELAVIAFSNATDYAKVVEKEGITDQGKPITYKTVELVPTEGLTEEQKKALAVIKEGKYGLEVKPYDKVRALELLGKHLGMWTEKVEVEGKINNPMEGLTTDELKKLINDG